MFCLSPGAVVIKQGDLVDSDSPGLVLVQSGKLDVFVKKGGAGDVGKKVNSYEEPGTKETTGDK